MWVDDDESREKMKRIVLGGDANFGTGKVYSIV